MRVKELPRPFLQLTAAVFVQSCLSFHWLLSRPSRRFGHFDELAAARFLMTFKPPVVRPGRVIFRSLHHAIECFSLPNADLAIAKPYVTPGLVYFGVKLMVDG